MTSTEAAVDARPALHPHYFRRAVHATGGVLVLYYVLPTDGAIALARDALLAGLLVIAILVDTLRMRGVVPLSFFFGLRGYEQGRVSAYVWFGVSAVVLLLFFPQAVAAPCLIAMAVGDPVMGEVRDRRGAWAGGVAGAAVGLGTFLLFGWGLWSVPAGAVVAIAESAKSHIIDDDLLVPLVPALLLSVALAVGVADLPPDLVTPWRWLT